MYRPQNCDARSPKIGKVSELRLLLVKDLEKTCNKRCRNIDRFARMQFEALGQNGRLLPRVHIEYSFPTKTFLNADCLRHLRSARPGYPASLFIDVNI
jgi:hypothetical protein